MAEWTEGAQQEFAAQLRQLDQELGESALDASDFAEAIRHSIDQEARELGVEEVSREHMRELFAAAVGRLGLRHSEGETEEPWVEEEIRPFWKAFVILFGVALPALTVAVEALASLCGTTFFDPIPTFWHVALVALVPLVNLVICCCGPGRVNAHATLLATANGLTLAVATVYSLIFLPMSPLAVFGLLYFGMGFLPLSPFTALWSAIICRRYLGRVADAYGRKGPMATWYGFAAGILTLIALEGRFTVTNLGVRMIASDSLAQQQNGIRLLRAVGDEEYLLRMCYLRQRRPTDIASLLLSTIGSSGTAEARIAYYRLTGEAFSHAERPRSISDRPLFVGRREVDRALGGITVDGKVEGLSLHSSRMDGSIDAGAALAYLEWTLEFANSSSWQHEASAQVWLPPGGVVSRLTLWVHGEEQEAAFAARGKVREAYEKIVRRRRDPVLVTTSGPDRVLVQCFPVPPKGEMKIRLGVTAPLVLATQTQGVLHLPRLVETNFTTPAHVQHAVWIEAKSQLEASAPTIRAESPKPALYAVRGKAPVGQTGVFVTAARPKGTLNCWTTDPISEDTHVVTQTIVPVPAWAPSRVVVVVDGSAGMAVAASRVAEALTDLPEGIEIAVLLASDTPVELATLQRGTTSLYQQVGDAIRAHGFAGGCDNVPALEQAWDLAAQSRDAAVVWVHGAVPVELSSASGLCQRWERRPDSVRLFDAQVTSGANAIARELDGLPQIESCRDLKALFGAWHGKQTQWRFGRRRVARQEAEDLVGEGKQTSAHLARLWAYRQVLQDATQGRVDAAVKLAASYRLVTPVTGAVVLETQKDFEDAGLEPAAADSVPSIPEPEMVLLMVVALVALLWTWWRRRVTCGAA